MGPILPAAERAAGERSALKPIERSVLRRRPSQRSARAPEEDRRALITPSRGASVGVPEEGATRVGAVGVEASESCATGREGEGSRSVAA